MELLRFISTKDGILKNHESNAIAQCNRLSYFWAIFSSHSQKLSFSFNVSNSQHLGLKKVPVKEANITGYIVGLEMI